MRKLLVITVIATAAAACAARIETPRLTVSPPAAFPLSDGVEPAAVEREWWRHFQDDALTQLIDEAFAANRDLRAAAARHAALVELAGATALNGWPHGGAEVMVGRQHLSEAEANGRADRTLSVSTAGLTATWEVDLFGRLRSERQSSAATAAASAMDVRGAQVALAAQVAAAYFEYRGAVADGVLIESLQARLQQQLNVIRTLIAAGRVTRLDLLRAQQIEQELETERATAVHQSRAARNRLAILTARTAEELSIAAPPAAAPTVTAIAIGTPAELLQRRPDVAAAEARLAAAGARAGMARADLFPRVQIDGRIGLIAGGAGMLAQAASAAWLIAPRLTWHALDLPRLRRQANAAGALVDAAFAEYEQAVLTALDDTATALSAYDAANRAWAAQQARAQAATDASGIVTVQYREGLVDSLVRTQADRDAIAAALGANRAMTRQRLAVVDIYRAMGGGWR